MALLCSGLCLLTVQILYKIERKESTKFTPVFALGFIYSVIMLTVSLYDAVSVGHYKMSHLVPLYSILFIFIFWLVGRFLAFLFRANNKNFVRREKGDLNKNSKNGFNKILLFFLILFLSILVVNFITRYRFHIDDTVELKSYYSNGIMGHITNFISVLFLAISIDDRSLKFRSIIRLASFLWVLVLTLFNAKYTMFMYAVALLIVYTIKYPRKFTFKRILLALVIISCAFFVTYIFRFLVEGKSLLTVPYDFIWQHFIYYISCGYYAFSSFLEFGAAPTSGVGVGVFFAPIINIIRLFTGKDFISSTSAFIDINFPGGYTSTNVYTLFGSIWLEMGLSGLVLCIVLLAVIMYTLYFTFLHSKNKYMVSLFAYACSTLVFGFFNCFYGMFGVWEYIVLLWIVSVLYHIYVCRNKVYSAKLLKVKSR